MEIPAQRSARLQASPINKLNFFIVINGLQNKPELKNLLMYIQARQDGLKDKADFFLDRFTSQMKNESFSKRKDFVEWVCLERYQDKNAGKWIPHEVQDIIISPTLKEWKDAEPTNPIPHRWLNTTESLIKAIDLDPGEQIARYQLFFKIISFVDYNQHALFDNVYHGNPEEDLGLLNLLLLKLPGLTTHEPEQIFEEVLFRAKAAEYYIRYSSLPEPKPDTFLNWLSSNFPKFDFSNYFTPVDPPEEPQAPNSGN